MTAPDASHVSDPGAAGAPVAVTAGDHVICNNCGYDLRGLPAEGNCPECGAPIAWSTRDDPLRHRPTRWIGILAQAMAWQVAGNVLGLVLTFVWFIPVIVMQEEADGENPLVWLLWILTTVVDFGAAWFLTRPEPGAVERWPSVRGALRWTSVATTACAVLVVIPGLFGERSYVITDLALQTAVLVVVGLWYVYVGRIALRLGHPGLAFACRLLLVAAVAGIAAVYWYASLSQVAWLFAIVVPYLNPLGPLIVLALCAVASTFVYLRLRSVLMKIVIRRASEEPAADHGPA